MPGSVWGPEFWFLPLRSSLSGKTVIVKTGNDHRASRGGGDLSGLTSAHCQPVKVRKGSEPTTGGVMSELRLEKSGKDSPQRENSLRSSEKKRGSE